MKARGAGEAVTLPVEVPTQATVAFLGAHLPVAATLIEVGCGDGHVALELLKLGYHVAAVDADPETVARARERGVPAVHATWPGFESAPVDAVVFTRSLHHIEPLAAAIGRARDLLRPTGVLLVEDFAFDEVDPPAIAWFREVLGSRDAGELVDLAPGQLAGDLLAARDPAAVWREHHERHQVHSGAAMTRAIAEGFTVRETRSVPYLYRYLVPVLPGTPQGVSFIEGAFREETRLGTAGAVGFIGRRVVGSPR